MSNIIPQKYTVDRDNRSQLKQHDPLVIWFTGLSGSGKSTVANRVEKELNGHKIHTYTLDGDNVRSGLNSDLGFTKEDRTENLRRVAEVAKLFLDAGTVVLAASITPLETDREMIRKIVGREHLVEIYVNTSLKACEERDVKGLYEKARTGEIPEFTGISSPYEIPKQPDITIDTENEMIDESVQKVLHHVLPKLRINRNE